MAMLGCGRGSPGAPAPTAKDAASPVATAPAGPESEASANLTPDQLLGQGPPTFVLGTLGDAATDRMIAAQAELIRGLFPGATVVLDTSIDVAAGPSAWPPRPVLYGGAHVNAVIAALGPTLPVQPGAEQISVGGETYRGAAVVIAAIPAGASHPAFVLYAATGTPGVVEINSVRHGGDSVLIADAHGRLQTGTWLRRADGTTTAALGPQARRIPWRFVEREVAGVSMRVGFPAQVPAAADEAAVVEAVVRGLAVAAARLQVAAIPPITAYVYPDRRSKTSLTGDGGDGHALALASALHVIRVDPAQGSLERLVAHEGSHVIAGLRWGPAGSALIGEGVAVWAAGGYGGVSLADWARRLDERPTAATLLPMTEFRGRREADTYPLGGLLVTVAVEQVGLDAVRDHLYPATLATWADACKAAGTTAEALDAAVAARR